MVSRVTEALTLDAEWFGARKVAPRSANYRGPMASKPPTTQERFAMAKFYRQAETAARTILTDAEPLPPPNPTFPRWIEALLTLARQKNRDPNQLMRSDLLRLYCLPVSVARAVALLLSAPPAPRRTPQW